MMLLLIAVTLIVVGFICYNMSTNVPDPTDYGWIRLPDAVPNDVLSWYKGLWVLFYNKNTQKWTIYYVPDSSVRIVSDKLTESFLEEGDALMTRIHD